VSSEGWRFCRQASLHVGSGSPRGGGGSPGPSFQEPIVIVDVLAILRLGLESRVRECPLLGAAEKHQGSNPGGGGALCGPRPSHRAAAKLEAQEPAITHAPSATGKKAARRVEDCEGRTCAMHTKDSLWVLYQVRQCAYDWVEMHKSLLG